jgi:hypothetical protein
MTPLERFEESLDRWHKRSALIREEYGIIKHLDARVMCGESELSLPPDKYDRLIEIYTELGRELRRGDTFTLYGVPLRRESMICS